MAKTAPPSADPDVLVLGSHPCAAFAATLLRQNSTCRVIRADVPGDASDDRLIVINPELFELHATLAPLKKKLEFQPIHGLKFLADEPPTASEFVNKAPAAYVTGLKPLRQAMHKLADDHDVTQASCDALEIHRIDDAGVHVTLDGKPMVARLLIVAAPAESLSPASRRTIGLPDAWEPGVLHRYSYVKCKGARGMSFGSESAKPQMPMSLDLMGKLMWAWVLPGPGCVQFAVEQPLDQGAAIPADELLRHWLDVLVKHGLLKSKDVPSLDTMVSVDLPFAGALAQEDVANRTLLIGPAGGFYTACAEDVYPACWSAVFAADAVKRALKEKHPQDALQVFRHKWGATLGDYLRGPQQNLRFLLPLVYRNKTMTARLSEAILFGKSVVR